MVIELSPQIQIKMAAVDDITNCPVCLELYNLEKNIPRLLSCTHSLCNVCVEKLQETTKIGLTCPQCRKTHSAEVPQNKYIIRLINERYFACSSAVIRCSLTEGFTVGRCKEHNQKLGLYCKNTPCKRQICHKCLLRDHQQHDVIDIEDQYEEDKQELKRVIDDVKMKLKSARCCLEKIKTQIDKNIQEESEKVESDRTYCLEQVEQNFKDQKQKSDQINLAAKLSLQSRVATLSSNVFAFATNFAR